MKKECEIINDLLPNYVENLVSEETKKFVNEHISNCEQCKKQLEILREDRNKINLKSKDEQKIELDYLKKYNKCTKFHAETEQLINRNIRLEKNKPENKRKWKLSRTKIKFINERTGKEELYNISLAEAICRFSIALENIFDGKINKVDIRNKILQADDFCIGQENQSYSYF